MNDKNNGHRTLYAEVAGLVTSICVMALAFATSRTPYVTDMIHAWLTGLPTETAETVRAAAKAMPVFGFFIAMCVSAFIATHVLRYRHAMKNDEHYELPSPRLRFALYMTMVVTFLLLILSDLAK